MGEGQGMRDNSLSTSEWITQSANYDKKHCKYTSEWFYSPCSLSLSVLIMLWSGKGAYQLAFPEKQKRRATGEEATRFL